MNASSFARIGSSKRYGSVATLGSLVAVAISLSSNALAGPVRQPLPQTDHVVAARHIYGVLCSSCHEEQVGPNLRGLGLPEQLIVQTVRHGQSAMPAFAASEISDPDLAALAKLISASRPKTGKPK